MENKHITLDLSWIDDAFSKNYVDELEAACCLTDGQNKVYFGCKVSCYFVDYEIHPILRINYMVIVTWDLRGHSLLDFIDKAISKNLQNFRQDFLLEKCKKLFVNMSPDDQKRFISVYFYISRELNLVIKNKDTACDNKSESQSSDKKEYPWVPHAKKIYNELCLQKSSLNAEQKAKKIEKEMQQRLSKGDKNMTKRGGKQAPSYGAILRHALQNND